MKVIGAGFGRTGTLSLKTALERVGFDKCYHMFEVHQNPEHMLVWEQAHAGQAIDWATLFQGYQATVDWPSCNFWREQRAAFPEAKIILSLRDSQAWYDSVMNTIYPITLANLDAEDDARRRSGRWAMELIWEAKFGGRMTDRDHVIACYEQHNRSVIDAVPEEDLLVFEPGDGWAPLCNFLGVEIPQADYPRSNSTAEFQVMMQNVSD